MGVVLIGAFMVLLDVTIVNVALAQIGKDLHRARHIDLSASVFVRSHGHGR